MVRRMSPATKTQSRKLPPAAATKAEDDGSDVPTRLLTCATQLFAQRGFEGTSVAAVVAAAGVTKGAMYHYFDSKDDLLYEIYARVMRVTEEQFDLLAEPGMTASDRLRAIAEGVVETSLESLDELATFLRSMHQLAEDKQELVRKGRRSYRDRCRSLVEEGQQTGEFRSDISAEIVVEHFFGSVHSLPMWYRPDRSLTPKQVGVIYAELLMSALAPRQ